MIDWHLVDWTQVPDSALAEAEDEKQRRYFARERAQRRARDAEIDRIAADPVLLAQKRAEEERDRRLRNLEYVNGPDYYPEEGAYGQEW